MTISTALAIHSVVVAGATLLAAWFLRSRGLLTALHSGTWVLFACFLYFVFNPAASLITGALSLYEEALSTYTREGASRVLWILVVILLGMASFIASYVTSGSHNAGVVVTAPVRQVRWTALNLVVVACAIGFGLFGILYYRTAGEFVDPSAAMQAQFDGGRIVGGVTGYTVVAHKFYIFPAVFLVFRGPTTMRRIGLALVLGFVGLRLYDSHDRASVVTILAAVAMVALARGRWRDLGEGHLRTSSPVGRRVKRLAPFAFAAGVAVALMVRGHTSISQFDETRTRDVNEVAIEANTAMLPPLYARAFLAEENGYDYGVPVLTRALFGWLPRQYFPWKDDLTDVLLDETARRTTPSDQRWIAGPKMTLVGSLYEHGGVVAVVIGMWLLGWMATRLDRLIVRGRTDMSRCLGIVWMADIWMIFAGSTVGIMVRMFTTGLPFVALWLAAMAQRRGTHARGAFPSAERAVVR